MNKVTVSINLHLFVQIVKIEYISGSVEIWLRIDRSKERY